MLGSGVVLAGVLLCVWGTSGHPAWALIAAIFAGVLPASRGLSGLIASRSERRSIEARSAPPRLDAKSSAAAREKAVLRIARDKGGRVTPSLVALESELSLEEAGRVLDEMAAKGNASMRVRDDGRVEYEFAEFMEPSSP